MRRRNRTPSGAGRVVFGLLVLAVGVILTLDNLHVVRSEDIFRYWPLALIVFGLARTLQCRGGWGSFFWGTVTVLGGLLLLSKLHYISWNVWDLWPVLLILWGISIVGRAFSHRPSGKCWSVDVDRSGGTTSKWNASGTPSGDLSGHAVPPPGAGTTSGNGSGSGAEGGSMHGVGSGPGTDHDATIDAFTIFGGTERTICSQNFRGGRITAIMGGCEIDLRRASIAQGEAKLEVFSLWGGIELRVPEDWKVVMHVTPVLGGAEDSTIAPTGDCGKTLVVTGEVLMGGFEIKN